MREMMLPSSLSATNTASASSLRALSDEDQRRLILRAAREISDDAFAEVCSSQPTLKELENGLSENVWTALLFIWTVFVPIAAVLEFVTILQIRSAVAANWQTWLAEPHPEVEQRMAEVAIRRMLKTLPRSQRKNARQISRGLERISHHWNDFQRKLKELRSALEAIREEALEAERREIVVRLAEETDGMTCASLQRLLRAIEGQQEVLRDLRAWRARLEAAQAESTQSLRHLRSRLALLVAGSGRLELAALSEAAEEIQTLCDHLASTHAAAEEILQLRA